MDNFSPKENLFEKEPMAQKIGPKVLEWTTSPQRKISLKKNQWLKRLGPKCWNGQLFPKEKKPMDNNEPL
jgi:hypothetical protein